MLDMVGVAHSDLDAALAILHAARNECTEFNSTGNSNKGADAKSWALDYGVDLGAGLETCVNEWGQMEVCPCAWPVTQQLTHRP